MTDLRLGSAVMERSGNGPAVMMVHGLGGTSNSFQTLLDVLGDYEVLRLDLPGAGRSALRPGQSGIDGMVAFCREALRTAGLERAHFVGHSMGTLVCQHLAARDPAAVASLTLFGPMLVPPPAARKALKERAETASRDGMAGIADAICQGSVGEAARRANPVAGAFVRESVLRQDPRGYAAHCMALSESVAADHSAITCPTLLVAGEADPVTPVAMAQKLGEKIKGATVEVLPSVAHWMMVEAPDKSAALLSEHLKKFAWS
ncbi:MAG: alpha/beta hydrolase [Pseudomonadota bacterium]